MIGIDEVASKILERLGPDAKLVDFSIPENSRTYDDQTWAQNNLRLVSNGSQQFFIANIECSDDLKILRSKDLLTLHMLQTTIPHTGKSQFSRSAIIQLTSEPKDFMLVSGMLASDDRKLVKYLINPKKPLSFSLDKVPALAVLPEIKTYENPVWIERIHADNGLASLTEIDINLSPEPGITILQGAQNTGKTFILKCLQESLLNGPGNTGSALQVELSQKPTGLGSSQFFSKYQLDYLEENDPLEVAMQPMRRLFGYGDDNGKLLIPITFESNGFQALERTLRRILVNTSKAIEGEWTGVAFDSPDKSIDITKFSKLLDFICRMFPNKQVIITCQAPDTARFIQGVALGWGVQAPIIELNGNKAVLNEKTGFHP